MRAAGGVVSDRNRPAPRTAGGGDESYADRATGAGANTAAAVIRLSKVPADGDAGDDQVGAASVGEANGHWVARAADRLAAKRQAARRKGDRWARDRRPPRWVESLPNLGLGCTVSVYDPDIGEIAEGIDLHRVDEDEAGPIR